MKNIKRLFLAFAVSVSPLILFALVPSNAMALEVPAMNGPVNDLAGVMSAAEKSELEAYLSAVNNQTGVQVAVLTVPSLDGDAIEDFSIRVAEKWKLGQADKDNGALLVVSIEDRSLRIEVGYGLEESLTDMKSGLIIRSVIVPYFKQGEYGSGIIAGAKNIVGIATSNAEIVSEQVRNPENDNSGSGSGIAGIIFVIVFILIMMAGRGRRGRGGSGGLLWGLLLGSMLSSSNRNDHWSSGGGFGGGGGFSGGGGGFGGGGASGGW